MLRSLTRPLALGSRRPRLALGGPNSGLPCAKALLSHVLQRSRTPCPGSVHTETQGRISRMYWHFSLLKDSIAVKFRSAAPKQEEASLEGDVSKGKKSRGFTLMEIVVVLAVIAVLAAILTPVLTSFVDRARLNAARNDVKNIAAALAQYNTDLKFYPIYKAAGTMPAPATSAAWDWQGTTGADAAYTGVGWAALTDTSGDLNLNVNTNIYGAPTAAAAGVQTYRGPYFEL